MGRECLAEDGSGEEFVVLAEEGTQAAIGRLYGKIGDGEVAGVEEREQAHPRNMVGAGDQPDVGNVIVARPCLEAGDVLARGLRGVVDDVLLLAGGEGCGSEGEDVGEARALVAAADEDGAVEAVLDLFERGFDTAGAAGEGGEALKVFRQGGEGCGERDHEQGEAEQVGAGREAERQQATAAPAQPRGAGEVQVEELRVRHADVLAGFGGGGNVGVKRLAT